MKQFDYLIFIGRFQPFHLGHELAIQYALEYANQVIVLIGSANSPRTIKNPFYFDERQQLIHQSFAQNSLTKHIICLPIIDVPYHDDIWVDHIKTAVANITSIHDKIGLIGHNKDDSSYYLNLFPQWDFVALPNFNNLSATPIRTQFIIQGTIDNDKLPTASVEFLQQFKNSQAYQQLQQEYQSLQAFQQSWQNAPYPPIFVTADAVIICRHHLLVISRLSDYGHQAIALPGGFVDQNETWLDACLREVQEETALTLKQNQLTAWQVFDLPSRSLRGRVITQAFLFVLDDNQHAHLPAVQADDDAGDVFWLSLDKLYKTRFFEDHLGIVISLLKNHCLLPDD